MRIYNSFTKEIERNVTNKKELHQFIGEKCRESHNVLSDGGCIYRQWVSGGAVHIDCGSVYFMDKHEYDALPDEA